jgi:putative membrane protein
MPLRSLMGPALYIGIIGFGITMLFMIKAFVIAWASVFIFLPAIVLGVHIVTRSASRGEADATESHLADFPYMRPLTRR